MTPRLFRCPVSSRFLQIVPASRGHRQASHSSGWSETHAPVALGQVPPHPRTTNMPGEWPHGSARLGTREQLLPGPIPWRAGLRRCCG